MANGCKPLVHLIARDLQVEAGYLLSTVFFSEKTVSPSPTLLSPTTSVELSNGIAIFSLEIICSERMTSVRSVMPSLLISPGSAVTRSCV